MRWNIYDGRGRAIDSVGLWGLLVFLWSGPDDCYCRPFDWSRDQ